MKYYQVSWENDDIILFICLLFMPQSGGLYSANKHTLDLLRLYNLSDYCWYSCCCIFSCCQLAPQSAAVSLTKVWSGHWDILYVAPYFTGQWAGRAGADTHHTLRSQTAVDKRHFKRGNVLHIQTKHLLEVKNRSSTLCTEQEAASDIPDRQTSQVYLL